MTISLIAGTIIERNGKIVMLRRSYEPGKNKLDLIGGFVDNNESIEHAAVRETKEECGFDVRLIEKLGAFDYFERDEKTIHVFIAEIIGSKLTSSIEGEAIWISLDEVRLDVLAFPQHIQIIDAYKKYRKLSIGRA